MNRHTSWHLGCWLGVWIGCAGASLAADDGVEISNEHLKATFTARDQGGIHQAYFARSDNEWQLIAESFHAPSPYPAAATQLYNDAADPKHRFVVPNLLRSVKHLGPGADTATVRLEGESDESSILQTVSLGPDDRHFRIRVEATLPANDPALDVIVSPFTFNIDGAPDFTHVPAHKRNRDNIIGDGVFYSPLALVQQGRRFMAIAPDVNVINAHPIRAAESRQHPDSDSFPIKLEPGWETMPTALDLDLESKLTAQPLLAFGMMDHIIKQHVFWLRDNAPGAMVRELSTNKVVYAFDLFVGDDAPPNRAYQAISRYSWTRYGAELFQQPRPQAMPWADYAHVCYPAFFQYQGYRVADRTRIEHTRDPARPELKSWQSWDLNGQPVGAFRLTAPQWYDLVYNTSWWNNVCDATGLYYWGTRLDNPDWVDKARRIINLTLSAPQQDGVFPSLYHLKDKRWIGSLWSPIADNYDPNVKQHFWDWENGAYMPSSASTTAGFLLQYYQTCEADERIIPYVRHYADFLIANMTPQGNVPSWFDTQLVPLPSMREFNADGGLHVWVLAELYRITEREEYATAARRLADFLSREVLPQQRWSDFETFYSCANKAEAYYDPRTGQPGRNLMSMIWALNGFVSLYDVTEDPQYLDAAEAVADFAMLFHTVWNPHYIHTGYPFGGYAAQLGDGEWLDQRAHRFADPLVKLGLRAGRRDLVERGIASARASLTLITHPRHKANDIMVHAVFPLGLSAENGYHEGFPQSPLASGPSWSSVGGLAAAAHVDQQLGGVYVDFSRGWFIGIDGVRVEEVSVEGRRIKLVCKNVLTTLPMPYENDFRVKLKIVGLPDGDDYQLYVNGKRHAANVSRRELRDFDLTISAL